MTDAEGGPLSSPAARRTRRSLLQGLGGSVAAALIGRPDPAAAQPAAVFRLRRIVVDTSRLIALGSPRMADVVARSLAPELNQTFGDLMASGDGAAPTLVVRISSISLSDYVGGRSFGGRGGGSKDVDYLEGSGVVTSGGRTLSETPILSALDAGYSGPWYLPDIDPRRIQAITHHFAYWLRREMGV